MTDSAGPPETSSAAASSPEAGQFWYYFDDDRWVWSDEVARIHGYCSADAVTPTTELLLEHKHPDHKWRMGELIDSVRRDRAAFSSHHRIIDTRGNDIPVHVIADTILNDARECIGTSGYYIVLSSEGRALRPLPINDERLEVLLTHRRHIEQAKGALQVVYHLDEDQAFDLLTWRSQETNTKVRDLAAVICERMASLTVSSDMRVEFDHLLLTAHEDTDFATRAETRSEEQ
ncbi:hypothetical protein GOEFS_059_00190 [Gordonia effusa NBRC 100432]|uniref:ANTAR domain-containing protein n=1 Tax=Gordonia effusa NBRC 100432 TaxID=1077974 RepID=H0R0I4_9ACTN|nr:ANTAR domain-containing protein [Gordonia effusa]GAB18585.1 hypothetical protein GOEFS_059_00190 [Gordonia effusa NBRC 100432]